MNAEHNLNLLASIFGEPSEADGPHLTSEQVFAFSEGTLDTESHTLCEQHLACCTECSEVLAHWIETNALRSGRLPLPFEVPSLSTIVGLPTAPQRVVATSIHESFFVRLSDWINDLFSHLLPLQLANADPPAGIVEHKFDSVTTDPFRARLVQNTAGEWSLRVFTSDAEAAKLKLRLEIKEEAPVLAFVPGLAGHYMAEVAISEQMACDLQSGHRPVFHPVETT
jgi:hypothetical protein